MSALKPRIGLIDCNCFFVSVEKTFRPDLNGKPVGVLSNGDSCFVARSPELKYLGVKMGQPLFQVQHLVDQHDIQLFSSNFSLYADFSARVMSILEEFSPSISIYSIDECFALLTGVYPCHKDPIAYGQAMRRAVLKQTGIPVCVGYGPTHVLAKAANFAAKKWIKTDGVVDLCDSVRRDKLLRILPVGEVWGVGQKTAAKLNQLGIYTAWELAGQSPDRIKSQLNVVTARIVLELNGISCIKIDEIPPAKQQIVCSRSFDTDLTQIEDLRRAVADFASQAAEKLRRQHSVCGCITVFIRTNIFRSTEPQYQRAASINLGTGTQDTRIIIGHAGRLLTEMYKQGYAYHKCGVQLTAIQPMNRPGQLDLFGQTDCARESPALMSVMDQINERYPKSVTIAATGFDKTWKPKADRLSKRYTTDWNELPVVLAK